MILHVKKNIPNKDLQALIAGMQAIIIPNESKYILVTSSAVKKVAEQYKPFIEAEFIFDSDIQLASINYLKKKREIQIGKIKIGGNQNTTIIITGPCSVESEEQIEQSAQLCCRLGITTLRAGCFKPRTSPYSFQGLESKGLQLLAKIREQYGLNIITEVRDATHVHEVIEYADIIQIGAKSMYDHGILRACGKTKKPVLLKRGFGTTLQEFIQAAEFILSGGNENVFLCERGIRTFETKTRFTLDLCGVAYLKAHTNLPIVVDPSHAMGYAYGVADLSRAAMAMGVDGLLIESHPHPNAALSDASQQLNHEEFTELYHSLKKVAEAVGRRIV